MPAVSESQQRLFGMVHAYQNGKLKHAPAKIRRIAKRISEEDAEHFARTKHDGLPERKKNESEKDASSNQPVTVKIGKKVFTFPSKKSALVYLSALPGIPHIKARRALEGNEPSIGNVLLYYP